MKHKATIKVPKCWFDLVDTVFPEDLNGILSEKENHTGNADPKPHYDDCRVISGHFPNGDTFRLSLCSGQSNYFGSLDIENTDGEDVYDSEPLDNFYNIVVEGENGDTYELKVTK